MKTSEIMEALREDAKKLKGYDTGFFQIGRVRMYTSNVSGYFDFQIDDVEVGKRDDQISINCSINKRLDVREFLAEVATEIQKQKNAESAKQFIKVD